MDIRLSDAGRRFNNDWIFKHLDYNFTQGDSYALLGPNGSGKSTLVNVLCGFMGLSKGSITFSSGAQQDVPANEVYRHIALCAPYSGLIDDFTLEEAVAFHFKFKQWLPGTGSVQFYEQLGFAAGTRRRQLKHFSSGMRQRVKLLLAIMSHTSMLVLDEPATNLDTQGLQWYLKLVETYSVGRLLVIASNNKAEHEFCKQQVDITHYK